MSQDDLDGDSVPRPRLPHLLTLWAPRYLGLFPLVGVHPPSAPGVACNSLLADETPAPAGLDTGVSLGGPMSSSSGFPTRAFLSKFVYSNSQIFKPNESPHVQIQTTKHAMPQLRRRGSSPQNGGRCYSQQATGSATPQDSWKGAVTRHRAAPAC